MLLFSCSLFAQDKRRVSSKNINTTSVVTEYTINDEGKTVIRKRGTLVANSRKKKTEQQGVKKSNASASLQKAQVVTSPSPIISVSEIEKIEQAISEVEKSDYPDKALRLEKLENALEKQKLKQAILRNRQ